MTAARQALERLLWRGERARARGADEHVRLAMTPASCPEYAGLDTLDAVESFHAGIGLAQRAGAITIERNKTGGDGTGLKRLKIVSLEALATHLGVHLLSERASEAFRLLSPWEGTYPVVTRILEAWTQGRKVRGVGPEAAQDAVAAIEAVESRVRDNRDERILRRESVRLFGDSKRLERLTPWLEVLVTGELTTSGLRKEDIWASLGLRREPQPMLLAGCGTVKLRDGEVALVKPYLGLPVDAVESIESDVDYLLTIENLASFHDAARAMPDARGLLIYTAGMPSPAWRALYARILRGLSPGVSIYHWGDIDEGGFRIAAALGSVATDAGRNLRPWLMSPGSVAAMSGIARQPSDACLAEMVRWALRAGWKDVADDLQCRPIRIEQESIDPSYPDS